MTRLHRSLRTRQAPLAASAAVALLVVACSGGSSKSGTATVAPPTVVPAATPPCNAEQRLTPARGDGSSFTAGSPERSSLIEPDTAGTRFTLSGTVLSITCRPVAGAVLDFWQADGSGTLDAAGYRLRGHQTTGPDGRYKLETIVPGAEPGRARHISVKVQGPNGAALATQLYFAGDASNATDSNFNDALAMAVEQEGGAEVSGFDFVLDVP